MRGDRSSTSLIQLSYLRPWLLTFPDRNPCQSATLPPQPNILVDLFGWIVLPQAWASKKNVQREVTSVDVTDAGSACLLPCLHRLQARMERRDSRRRAKVQAGSRPKYAAARTRVS